MASSKTLLVLPYLAVSAFYFHIENSSAAPVMNTLASDKFGVVKIFDSNYQKVYAREINDFLVKSLPDDDDAEANLMKAHEWFGSEAKKKALLNNHLVDALEQFTALLKVHKGEIKCNSRSHKILLKNDLATTHQTHEPDVKLEQLNRVEKVIRQVAMQHSRQCKNYYLEKRRNLVSKVDKDQLRYLQVYQNYLVGEFLAPRHKVDPISGIFKRVDLIEFVPHLKSLTGKKSIHITYDSIEDLAADDPDKMYLKPVFEHRGSLGLGDVHLRKDKIENLFEKYLIEPCEQYVNTLDAEVFSPFIYDERLLEPKERLKPPVDEANELVGFFTSLRRNQLCKLLLRRDQQEAILKGICLIVREGGN